MSLKAIILLAGEGTRLRPFSTPAYPKVLFSFRGRPLVCYHIDEFIQNGILEFVFVCNPVNRKSVRKILSKHYPKLQARLVIQRAHLGPAHALYLGVKDLKRSDYFILKYADRIDPSAKVKDLLKRFQENPLNGVIFLSKVKDFSRFGIARFAQDELVEIVEKPATHPPSRLAWRGISIFQVDMFLRGFLKTRMERGKKEVSPPEYVLRGGGRLNYRVVDYNRIDLGYPWDILAMNRALLKKFGGLNQSKRIGRGVRISPQSYIGPKTVLADNVQVNDYVSLERAYVGKNTVLENSYIMARTRIGGESRIKHSVIGRNCQIGDGFRSYYRGKHNLKVPVKGEYKDTAQKVLGVFLGHDVRVLAGLSSKPGRIVFEQKIVNKNIVHHRLPLRVILIDADNTLYATRRAAAEADKKAMAYLAHGTKFTPQELDAYWREKIVPLVKKSRNPRQRHRKYSYQKLIADFGLKKRGKQAFLLMEAELLKRLKLFPKVKQILRGLQDYQKVIISEDNQDLLDSKLKKLGLGKYFDQVIAAETVGRMKPDPRYYTLALAFLKILPEEAVMIGDDWEKDLALASDLGLRTVIVGEDQRAQRSIRGFQFLPQALKGL